MIIDFTPDEPGGRVYVIVILWFLSGLAGFVFRGWLLLKYREDLKISEENGATKARIKSSKRGIETSIIHMVVKLAVMTIGIGVAIVQWGQTTPPPPLDVTSVGLILIPWALTLDGFREYRHQKWLLANAAPTPEAGRLYTAKDVPAGRGVTE
jgi:hypothetical protein